MTNELTALLGIRHPIIQAPMAGVSTPQLAAAVARAGALGSIGVGAGSSLDAQRAIRAVRALGATRLNVNVFTHQAARRDSAIESAWLAHLAPHFARFGATPPASLNAPYTSFRDDPAMLEVLLRERVPVVSFHFGLPGPEQVAALKGAGCILLASATSVDEARQVEAAGIDVVVAQGFEAGGHRGVFDPAGKDEQLATLALLAQVIRAVRIPVVAAGGIMNGAGIKAALARGAGAAQLGTAFIGCPESMASARHRARLTAPDGADTVLTSVISGRPARGLVRSFVEQVDTAGRPALPDYPVAYDAAKALQAAARKQGIDDFAAYWAGQAYALARPMPAAQLVQLLVTEMLVE